MHSNNPNIAWVRAIQIPPQTSQITFIRIYRQPEALECTRVSRPKGQIASAAIFRVWIPNGTPMIVMNSARLPIKYSIAIMIPPKISQTRFPRIFNVTDVYSRITVLSFGYLTE